MTTTVEEISVDRRKIAKGDQLKFTHVRGTFTFMKAYIKDDGSIDVLLVVGGTTTKAGSYRSTRMFKPELIAKKLRNSTLEAKGLR